MDRRIRNLVLLALALAAGCGDTPSRTLDLATTTSVQNSGLLNHLLPIFQAGSGITVRVHATGSGRGLRMLADRSVDAVISHAPETEQQFLAGHPDWSYRKIAHNWFAVAGPAEDPAGVRRAVDVIDAFRRIAGADQAFISRGDESGTHERERSLWRSAGRQPGDRRLIVSGRGMAMALRHADQARAYILTDVPTFRQLAATVDLELLFENDARLSNSYAVVHRPGPEADTFAAWLGGPAGLDAIGAFRIDGQAAFTPWPDGCAHAKPDDAPCVR